ncbi:MAG: DNA repair protein [Xanthobacteraceae bacterium]|nr:DNA repair protein [Xanthobacteraceae bacterium]
MGPASPQPTLQRLRQTLAAIDPKLGPALPADEQRVELTGAVDAVLGGGLACGALHELAPAAPFQFGAAGGFAAAVAARASLPRGEVLWIATDFARREGGGPYGPGLDLFGLASSRLLVLTVARPTDVLWAMEEGLRCRALACVVAELTGEGAEADLTATRRLSLAAREGVSARVSGLGLLIRHRATQMPSAAATRWHVGGAPSLPDRLAALSGGLGRTRFDLSLRKNRRGPCGRWLVEWDQHERAFQPALSVGVAAPALDRPDRAPARRAG